MGEVLLTKALCEQLNKLQKKLSRQALRCLRRGDIQGFNALRDQDPGWRPGFTGKNFSDWNLAGANLEYAWFCGADLSRANLKGARFAHANFMFANLQGADCDGTNFRWAHLHHADFTGAKITQSTEGLPIHLK